jgi:hypothetical protein
MFSSLFGRRCVILCACVSFAAGANAQQIFSQSQLSTILGSGETMEDFEGNGLLNSGVGQITGNLLNSTSIFAGYGPGLTQPGATYSSPGLLYWNNNGYFGLNTRTLGDASGWRGDQTVINYTEAVTAFGFDLSGYNGYDESGTVSVYSLTGALVTSTAVNGGFFGWEDTSGIGSVVISATSGYIMIDNHGYGANPAPEPVSILLLGAGGAALLRRRSKK